MISGVEGVDPARRQMLIEMLDIDLSWWAACPGWLMQCMLGSKPEVRCCCTLLHVRFKSGLVYEPQAAEQGVRWAAEAGADLPRLVAPLRGSQPCSQLLLVLTAALHYVSTASIVSTMPQVLLLDEITVDMDVVGR
jgi:hypothetical protein